MADLAQQVWESRKRYSDSLIEALKNDPALRQACREHGWFVILLDAIEAGTL